MAFSTFLSRWASLYTATTVAEKAFEPSVAALGIPYRAQHPIFAAGYVVDFALMDAKIALEVDGDSHRGAKAVEHDRERTRKLERLGWVVVRCWNEEAIDAPAVTLQRMLLEAADRRNALNLLNPPKKPKTKKDTR
jgi:very-short-patch-repair endonuclease